MIPYHQFIFSYWDSCYDVDLMIDRVSLDLLYLQVIEEIDLGWIIAEPDTREILAGYEANKQKREVCGLYYNIRFTSLLDNVILGNSMVA